MKLHIKFNEKQANKDLSKILNPKPTWIEKHKKQQKKLLEEIFK